MVLESLFCLALNIYHEARGEPEVGQLAVAIVTLNRSVSRNKNVCEIVLEKEQFSWYNTRPRLVAPRDKYSWEKAKIIAKKSVRIHKLNNFDNIQYFHTRNVNPAWSKDFNQVMIIGNHIFYK